MNIYTVSKDLFQALDQKLITLLKGLSHSEWEMQTVAGKWTVKDIAAHLLDGNIRSLSILRDQYLGEKPTDIQSYNDLMSFLNKLNADWVQAMKRVSPIQLIEMLSTSGAEYCAYIASLDVLEKSVFSVAWAGEEQSYNGFHIAREYTEKWHHQQQIRLAVGRESELFDKKYYLPYLETSMLALPHFYRDLQANTGDTIEFIISEPIDEKWILTYDSLSWKLTKDSANDPKSIVNIDSTMAWRILTSSKSIENVQKYVHIEGDCRLGEKFLEVRAVMV